MHDGHSSMSGDFLTAKPKRQRYPKKTKIRPNGMERVQDRNRSERHTLRTYNKQHHTWFDWLGCFRGFGSCYDLIVLFVLDECKTLTSKPTRFRDQTIRDFYGFIFRVRPTDCHLHTSQIMPPLIILSNRLISFRNTHYIFHNPFLQ